MPAVALFSMCDRFLLNCERQMNLVVILIAALTLFAVIGLGLLAVVNILFSPPKERRDVQEERRAQERRLL
ncbi:hypothetical protein [Caballeronia sp. BR00000012568055]|uniref:hypothetical protein n=1 Tax=Caballeronia sp. BR00000012568055 TaxID=2918761 RepID=UPI0023F9D90B|nr:hypothetical protein [Caballeronia sp. BR00000012568055]